MPYKPRKPNKLYSKPRNRRGQKRIVAKKDSPTNRWLEGIDAVIEALGPEKKRKK